MIPRLDELQPATETTKQFLDALGRAGFSGDLAADLATRVVGATDNSIYQILPQAIVYPRSTADVARILEVANQAKFLGISLTARGGGTGTNGQSLTSGLIVDLGRHMHRIGALELPEGAGRPGSVTVQAGVVLDELNAAIAQHRVFFAPNLSPSSRATIGGMIATDASGQGSRVYGKTSEHVQALEIVLVDGSILHTKPLPRAVALAGPAWDSGASLAERLPRAVAELLGRSHSQFIEKLPKLSRFVTGYNLARAWDRERDLIDLTWLITGAEGSLGIVTEATLGLVPIPSARALAVLEFTSFEAALESAEAVLAREPASIETIDHMVLDLAREDIIFAEVGTYLPTREPPTRAINLVEFDGDDPARVQAKFAQLLEDCQRHAGEPGWPRAVTQAASEEDRRALWRLRAKGVGLLGNTPGKRKPVPFVEDTVVPPAALAAYVREFRRVLDREGLQYGMFGHVDVGCLHVRPALNLRDAEDEARVRRISNEVAALCQKFGGVLWGEHGKGFRSEFSPLHFGELFPYIEEVKGLFDPGQRLNPGKIATPPGRRADLATIEQPTRGHSDRQIDEAAQARWTLAIDCNGNGTCYSWDPDHIMCPSGRVTRDRVHTPKGRAGLMREWLRQLARHPAAKRGPRWVMPAAVMGVIAWPQKVVHTALRRWGRFDYSNEVKRAMDGCLGCKACATECPVKVDVPTFKSEFLELYHTRYLHPLKDHLIGRLEQSLRVMARAPRFFNFIMRSGVFKWVMARVVGMVDVPTVAPRSLRTLMRARGVGLLDPAELMTPSDRPRVILVQDAFTSFYEPEVVLAVRELFQRLGADVALAPFYENGKGLHVKGMGRAFRRRATKTAAALKRLAASGATLVTIDPAVALTYRDEYRHVLGSDLGFEVKLVQEALVALIPKPAGVPLIKPKATYRLYGHCTERALAGASQRQWAEVFARLGLRLELVKTGCCGMCGAFGHEASHAEESRGVWELSWGRWLKEEASPERVVVTGYSCRSQAQRMEGLDLRHPALILLDHLTQHEPGAMR